MQIAIDYVVEYTDGRQPVSMAHHLRRWIWSSQAAAAAAHKLARESGGHVVGVYSDGTRRAVVA